MRITVVRTAERKPPPVIVCPWLIDYPYEKVEKPER
jgi:hypothetical protein